MWPANAPIPPPPQPPMFANPAAATATAGAGQKNDIFVGNLAFNTTEEQLHQAFSDIGRVVNVRLVTDVDTGKPRGFAFVEFQDAQAALSAIRNMNDYELNGRRLRVNFSNSSHLEDLAGKLGMDLSQAKRQQQQPNQQQQQQATPALGTTAVADALKAMSKAEMYDVVAKIKELDAEEARRLLASHPQLPEAILFCMSKLDMVKTPMTAATAGTPMMAPPVAAAPAAPPRDPRQAAPSDPRAAAAANRDPRQAAAAAAAVDPRAPRADPRLAAASRIDPRTDPRSRPPPPPPPPPSLHMNSSVLDPALVQQVMSLTPQQIQQLPADKQQSILQLRLQITGGR